MKSAAYDQYRAVISGIRSTRKNKNVLIDDCNDDELRVYDYGTHYLLAFRIPDEENGGSDIRGHFLQFSSDF